MNYIKKSKLKSFVFILINDFSLIAFSNAIEPLRLANRLAQKQLYSWQITSETGERVKCSSGFYFDKVDSVVDSTSLTGAADTETSDQLNVAVLTLTAKNVTTAAIAAAKHKHALAINATGATKSVNILVNGSDLLFDAAVTPTANATLFINDINHRISR